MSYGRIPDEQDDQLHSAENEAPIGGSNTAAAYAIADSGFGGHFLLDDNVETYDNPLDKHLIVEAPNRKMLNLEASQQQPIAKPVANPPKKDILNPKNKVCVPCNREFNRRQAFVEHCRTVHGMKIRFAKAAAGATIINSKAFANQTATSTPQKSTIPSGKNSFGIERSRMQICCCSYVQIVFINTL
jgi:hypothetical protein